MLKIVLMNEIILFRYEFLIRIVFFGRNINKNMPNMVSSSTTIGAGGREELPKWKSKSSHRVRHNRSKHATEENQLGRG